MGEDPARRAREVAALQLGFDLGLTLVDTAEMYADGGAEEVVGEAIRGRRDELELVSKVLPHNASFEGTVRAAERSLRRLGVDTLDLYLLHWESPHPLEETLRAFVHLKEQGKIRAYGVSNFDAPTMERCMSLPGGDGVVANQVLYNLTRRGVEHSLLPACQQHGVVFMAYSPLEQGRLGNPEPLLEVARRHDVTVEEVAVAWVLRHESVVAIPKASDPEHVRRNAAAGHLVLDPEDLARLDAAFPAPEGEEPLETL